MCNTFWQLLKDLALWEKTLARKLVVTHLADRWEIMPICVKHASMSQYSLLEVFLSYRSNFLYSPTLSMSCDLCKMTNNSNY